MDLTALDQISPSMALDAILSACRNGKPLDLDAASACLVRVNRVELLGKSLFGVRSFRLKGSAGAWSCRDALSLLPDKHRDPAALHLARIAEVVYPDWVSLDPDVIADWIPDSVLDEPAILTLMASRDSRLIRSIGDPSLTWRAFLALRLSERSLPLRSGTTSLRRTWDGLRRRLAMLRAQATVRDTPLMDHVCGAMEEGERRADDPRRLLWQIIRHRMGIGTNRLLLVDIADGLGISRQALDSRLHTLPTFRSEFPWAEALYQDITRLLEAFGGVCFVSDLPSWIQGFDVDSVVWLATALGVKPLNVAPGANADQTGVLFAADWTSVRTALQDMRTQISIDTSIASSDSFFHANLPKGGRLTVYGWTRLVHHLSPNFFDGQQFSLSRFDFIRSHTRSILAASPHPLHWTQIAQAIPSNSSVGAISYRDFRSATAYVADFIPLGRGVLGTDAHFGWSSALVDTVRSACKDIMQRSPNRQWGASEMEQELGHLRFPKRFPLSAYRLIHALSGDPKIVNVGRGVFALPTRGASVKRQHIRSSIIDVLRKAGKPLSASEICEQVSLLRPITLTVVYNILSSPSFMGVGSGRYDVNPAMLDH